jgi:Fe2+ transport system protein FeoA
VVSETKAGTIDDDFRTVPLCDLREGDTGLVCVLHDCPHRGRDGRCHRHCCLCEECELLRAMGITERCRLRMCRRGKRCIVQVNSTRLGISNAIARNILVSPVATKP